MNATRRSAGSAALGLAVAGLLGAALAPVSADDPVGTNVTFNREIVRIIQRKCESCHTGGGLSIPLEAASEAESRFCCRRG